MAVVVDGGPLSFDDVIAVTAGAEVTVGAGVAEKMAAARRVIEQVTAENRTVYGVNTGIGALASTRIGETESAELQVALVRSHAGGVGRPLPAEMVRAIILLRARTLSQGHSGTRLVIVERLVEMLNAGIVPVIPEQGSVGASGDLAAFAHMALPLIGEGEVMVEGKAVPAAPALAAAGIEPITLQAKEGLSLLNGTEGMLAMGVIGLHRAGRLLAAADLACAMSIEALKGSSRPFRPEIHQLRPHPGQITSAANIARLLEDSGIGASHAEDFDHAVQDAYSLRCAPQVHGACRDAIAYAAATFEREIGSVVDNPIVFPETGDVVSAGNFHGQPLALALDTMAIAITELASISERRIDRMLDPGHSAGLPAFLSPNPGVNSGLMLSQYTAAALVAENRVLSHPASVESIPTSGSQEDHVSMGWGAGRKLGDVLLNTRRVLAIELMCAAQGLDYRKPLETSPPLAAAHSAVREVSPSLEVDRPIAADIEAISDLVADGSLVKAAGGFN